MNKDISRDAIRQEFVNRFGVIITDNDPLWTWLALNNIVIDQYREVTLNGFDGLQVNLDEMYKRHTETTKLNSEHYVTQSLNALIQVHGGIQARFEEMLAKERMAFRSMLSEKVSLLQKWGWVVLGSAVASILAVLVTAALMALGGK